MSAPTIAAIPTRYNGTQFRSRLEAKWAAMFDLLGWSWEYEPIDLPGWIPDFRLGATGLLFEVCPRSTIPEHIAKITASGWRERMILLTDEFRRVTNETVGDDVIAVGDVLYRGTRVNGGRAQTRLVDGEIVEDIPQGAIVTEGFYGHDTAVLHAGIVPGRGPYPESNPTEWCLSDSICDYTCAVCGKHDKYHPSEPDTATRLIALWREAGNRVQWKGAGATP